MEKNRLKAYFDNNNGKLIHKWVHYFEIYDRHFAPYRGKEITVMEFGVSHGGSLDMWRDYFGKKARIIGVDINPECEKFKDKNTEIFIGDQEDKSFLKKLMDKVGPVDIVIEDGGHTMVQQNNTFEVVYPTMNPNGVFLIEDLHTSYWDGYGGGFRKRDTFIEKAKDLIDELNAWHSKDNESFRVTDFTATTHSMHFYDSIIVFERRKTVKPHHEMTGHQTIDESVYSGGQYVKL
jgi:23S rRNA U2552 (ribose-2'-O)-methylase RlmE/FtsJ